jgi:hypothetical protein
MKDDDKLAELVPLTHMFAKRSFTQLDPKLMFWDVSDHFVAARNSM